MHRTGRFLLAAVVLLWTAASAAQTKPDSPPPPTGDRGGGLPAPRFSPSALPVSSEPLPVRVGVSLSGTLSRPPVLLLEETDAAGAAREVRAMLRDDGRAPDRVAGDGFYLGELALAFPGESVLTFRLRERDGKRESATVSFSVTSLPLGLPAGGSRVFVESGDGADPWVANEVLFGLQDGAPPSAAREAAAKAASALGLPQGGVRIVGSLPALGAYLVRFDGDATAAAVSAAVAAFRAVEGVRYADPNERGRGSSWYHDAIGVPAIRAAGGTGSPFAGVVTGEPSVGVAVVDWEIDCSAGNDLDCAPNPFASGVCRTFYDDSLARTFSGNLHGTKVAALVAGEAGTAESYRGVEEGVAYDASLFPFNAEVRADAVQALDCAAQIPLSAGADAQVVNMSRDYSPNTALGDATCEVVCANQLLVFAAGNFACSSDQITRAPGLWNDPASSPPSCSCGDPIAGSMLTVGAVDSNGDIGDSCPATRSKRGELYAPGWGVPPGFSDSDGTSWAAPLVAGCAAVYAAVEGPALWDASVVEARLKATAVDPDNGGPKPLALDCAGAIFPPYDLAFVLDRSGSMNRTTSAGVTRWTALADAALGFADLLRLTAPAGSRFGLTLFAGGVIPGDPVSGLVPISGLAADPIGTVTPSGSTAMGAGLQQALGEFDDPTRRRVVVLFSDGEQNQDPLIDSNGCAFTNPASDIHPNCPGDAPDGSTRIVTVGIGQPSGQYLTTLTNLAERNGGTALITSDGADFDPSAAMKSVDDAFLEALAPALSGSSPQRIDRFAGNTGSDAEFGPFPVNRGVAKVVLSFQLPEKLEAPTLRRLFSGVRISRDGDDVTRQFAAFVGGNASRTLLLHSGAAAGPEAAVAVRPPLEGEYRVRFGSTGPDRTHDFRLTVYADDHHLDLATGVAPDPPRAGARIEPTLQLHWRGLAIEDATVVAQVLAPGDDLGDALARHPLVVDPSSAPDAGSPGTQKYWQLLAEDDSFRAALAPGRASISLVHQGDGVYRGTFDPGDVSGVYQVRYLVEADGPAFGGVRRERIESLYARFAAIDLEASGLLRDTDDKRTVLSLRPVTVQGRFLGPAQASALQVAGAGVSVESIVDHQDGRYTITLLGDPQGDVSLGVLGEPFYEGAIANIPARSRGFSTWWWLLVLVLVAAIGIARRIA